MVAAFDAEHISSNGGLVLLHRTDRRFGLMRKFAACFRDPRAPDRIHHSVEELVRQRVFGIACGYEDLVAHATLRQDPLLATVVGKADPAQQLASPSTLNRLELTPADATQEARYRKVVYDTQAVEAFFVDAFLDVHRRPLREMVLGLDATDAPIHGTLKGGLFHGYYGNHCYLPLYIFVGDCLLGAKLRTSDVDAAAELLWVACST